MSGKKTDSTDSAQQPWAGTRFTFRQTSARTSTSTSAFHLSSQSTTDEAILSPRSHSLLNTTLPRHSLLSLSDACAMDLDRVAAPRLITLDSNNSKDDHSDIYEQARRLKKRRIQSDHHQHTPARKSTRRTRQTQSTSTSAPSEEVYTGSPTSFLAFTDPVPSPSSSSLTAPAKLAALSSSPRKRKADDMLRDTLTNTSPRKPHPPRPATSKPSHPALLVIHVDTDEEMGDGDGDSNSNGDGDGDVSMGIADERAASSNAMMTRVASELVDPELLVAVFGY
ncbi:hypothetical protein BZA70DRAFT_281272 [Myxozyma melibiosi]|uniref:Uncharacterized protein n=1 Tax=Myxozyma melibiosi TaxID=54550 RepID=A0ABR1F2E1_9ASCO